MIENVFENIFTLDETGEFGFYFENNRIKFYLPSLLYKEEMNVCSILKKYNMILNKYISSKERDLLSGDKHQENDKTLSIIEAYINILNDFYTYNELYMHKSTYSNNNKKIQWNKTLRDNNIFVSNNNIVYGNYISKNKKIDTDNKYYFLYKEALKRSRGIFLGTDEEDIIYPVNFNEQKYYLYKYAETHFKDRELHICKNLIAIYLNLEENNLKDNLFKNKYHTSFEYIWEHMVNEITKKYHESKELNKSKYVNSSFEGFDFRIDTLLKKGSQYFIIDSKFYNSYIDKKFPKTSDIAKQYCYKLLISKKFNIKLKNITNIFVFPKNNEKKDPEFFEIHEYENDSFYTIHCLALDINEVINLYLKNEIYEKLYEYIDQCNL